MNIVRRSSHLGVPSPREEVELLQTYSAPLEGRRDFLRLDFNENTIGPSPLVLEALRNISREQISIYPEYSGLKEAYINNLMDFGTAVPLNINQVGLFNGVDAAIHAIFHAYGEKGDLMLTTNPTFGYYMPCAYMQGMEVIALPYEGNTFQFPFEDLMRTLCEKTPRILILCNPNNPTGTRLAPEKVIQLASLSPDTLLVIDELYEAFAGDSVLPLIDFSKHPNVVVLRSLSKTAGLAGLRIGFAIGNAHVLARISRVIGPYDINSFAVVAAKAALHDQSYINSYVKEIFSSRDWIKSQLNLLNNRYHIDGGNYFLLWTKSSPAETVSLFKDQGILVRDMKGKKLIEGSVRVTLGTRKQMEQFWTAFLEIENLSSRNIS